MAERIEGNFPGGPTRGDPDERPRRAPRLRRVEEIEDGVARRVLGGRRRRRGARIRAGVAIVFVLAFAVGVALGLRSHTTVEALTAEQQAARARDLGISTEVNRVLLELWKMEDIEHSRNTGRAR